MRPFSGVYTAGPRVRAPSVVTVASKVQAFYSDAKQAGCFVTPTMQIAERPV